MSRRSALDVKAARIVREFTRGLDVSPPGPHGAADHTLHGRGDELCDRIAIMTTAGCWPAITLPTLSRMLQQQPVFEIGVTGITDRSIGSFRTRPAWPT